MLRITPDQAELLLAEGSVAALLEPGPDPRFRVEAPTTPTLLDDERDDAATNTEKQRGQTEI